ILILNKPLKVYIPALPSAVPLPKKHDFWGKNFQLSGFFMHKTAILCYKTAVRIRKHIMWITSGAFRRSGNVSLLPRLQ
ncbi:hypothetical protein, partial [Eisenbergiella tayi]|uniref:hypothetical protein n=1 Tax=Eisenbergiella tayi TaxID=1432052 RepID=UPI003AF1405F